MFAVQELVGQDRVEFTDGAWRVWSRDIPDLSRSE